MYRNIGSNVLLDQSSTIMTKICPICGTEFTPKRSDAVYCSAKCRVSAARNRQKKKTTQQLQARELRVKVFIKALQNHDKEEYAEIIQMLLNKYDVDAAFDTAEKVAWIVQVRF